GMGARQRPRHGPGLPAVAGGVGGAQRLGEGCRRAAAPRGGGQDAMSTTDDEQIEADLDAILAGRTIDPRLCSAAALDWVRRHNADVLGRGEGDGGDGAKAKAKARGRLAATWAGLFEGMGDGKEH